MNEDVFCQVVYTLYKEDYDRLEANGDLLWIGFKKDSLKNIIDVELKKKRISFSNGHKLLELLAKFDMLESIEMDRLRKSVETLVDDGRGTNQA